MIYTISDRSINEKEKLLSKRNKKRERSKNRKKKKEIENENENENKNEKFSNLNALLAAKKSNNNEKPDIQDKQDKQDTVLADQPSDQNTEQTT